MATSETYLAQMLEGYENGIEGVTNYIKETTVSLENAQKQKQEMLDSIADLKECLGMSDEGSESTEEAASRPPGSPTPIGGFKLVSDEKAEE